ncbi:MAG: hypothetical protein KY476_07380, partial [Planctomycetes bacterium]|nr:hypothetical protein [Planctomycetota bacterium]
MAVETLEDRTLLTQLIDILPNDGLALQNGDIRHEAPTEFTFKFSPGDSIDPATVGGIQIVRSGFDGTFGDANDRAVAPGFVGIGDRPNEVVFRFAETLPDDRYQITILGAGSGRLQTTLGVPFNGGVDQSVVFELDLGARVVAVDPQPVVREIRLDVDDISQISDGDTFTVSGGAHAGISSQFGTSGAVSIGFTALEPGPAGDRITLIVNTAALGVGMPPAVSVTSVALNGTTYSTITAMLNSTAGSLSTAQDLIDAINAHPAARTLVAGFIADGDPATDITTPATQPRNLQLTGGGGSVTFEFDDVTANGGAGNGVMPGNVAISFDPTPSTGDTPATLAARIEAVIDSTSSIAAVGTPLILDGDTFGVTLPGVGTTRFEFDLLGATPGVPAGAIADGDFFILDSDLYEFDNDAQAAAIVQAVAGVALVDGEKFTLDIDGAGPVTFELDSNVSTPPNAVAFTAADTAETVASSIAAAINAAAIGASARVVGDKVVIVAQTPGESVVYDALTSGLTQQVPVATVPFTTSDTTDIVAANIEAAIVTAGVNPLRDGGILDFQGATALDLEGVPSFQSLLGAVGLITGNVGIEILPPATAVDVAAAIEAALTAVPAIAASGVTRTGANLTLATAVAGGLAPNIATIGSRFAVARAQSGSEISLTGTLLSPFTPRITTTATAGITLSDGALDQRENVIVVHFNEDDLDQQSAENPAYYQLIDTKGTLDHTDDTAQTPTSVIYDALANTAVLTFAANLAAATYRVRVGVEDTPSNSVINLGGNILNFDGQDFSFVNPPDTVGDVGMFHYVQATNDGSGTNVTIYNKSDGSVAVSQFNLSTLALGATGGTPYIGAGDPIVLYDHLADRWVLMEFDPPGNDRIHIFISDTGIPTGNGADWTHYRFTAPNFPDYPKLTLWPDAYFIGTNEFDNPVYALPRQLMLAGAGGDITANVIRRTTPDRPFWQRNHIMPADLDGNMTPAPGAPGIFVRQVDDEYTNPGGAVAGNDFLEVWEFSPDFNTPGNTTYTMAANIPIADFDYIVGDEFLRGDIEQPGTGLEIDSLPHYIMWRLQYRNFGTHESLVGNFTVDVGEDGTPDGDGGTAAEQAGVRWFELRNVGAGWTLQQEGDIAPDSNHRWMAAASMDGAGNIAVGYNVSSTTVSPGIRYTGRLASDPTGQMRPERVLVAGSGFNNSQRWGDYSAMSIDPVDDSTFWFTGMYTDGTGRWATRIGAFTIDDVSAPMIDDDNSSFSTSMDLGLLTDAQITITSQIEPQPIPLPPLPGGTDEPGHREIPVEAHIGSTGTSPVLPGPITQQRYNFQETIGVDPQGNTLFNAITEEQKQRAREIFEIYADLSGIEFIETPNQGILVATGDMRAVDPTLPVGPGGVAGVAGGGKVVMDPADTGRSPADDVYGGVWMRVALHEIGHAIGLGHSYDIPSIQGAGLTGEPVFPGDHDRLHLNRLFRPDATDIDLSEFNLAEAGLFTAEIFAERLGAPSLLNSALTLFRETGPSVFDVIARNDDYFSNDAFIELALEAGRYFVGVTSTGNLDYDPNVSDTGSGGTTDGSYELRLNFLRTPNADPLMRQVLLDETGTVFDGDADGVPGGVFDFWFQASDNTAGNTVFIDKAAQTSSTAALGGSSDPVTFRVADAGVFPSAMPFRILVDSEELEVTGVNQTTTIASVGGIAATGNTVTFDVDDASLLPTATPFDIRIDNEELRVTSVAGNTLTALRAVNGTTIAAHAFGATVSSVDDTLTATRAVNGTTASAHAAGATVRGAGGTVANPFSQIDDALVAVTARNEDGSPLNDVDLVRIVGNGGDDANLSTPDDARPYLIGFDDSFNFLEDSDANPNGTQNLEVPQGVTLVIDQGAVLKLQNAIIDVGSSSDLVDRSAAALQVLGTPANQVFFTSHRDDSIGGDTDGLSGGAIGGDWGGLVFRADSDLEAAGIFLSAVTQADISFGGGEVFVDSFSGIFSPIHIDGARPTVSFNTITNSADEAMSADPNSFDETIRGNRDATLSRVGPDIHGNRLVDNSLNALFVRIETLFGEPIDVVTVPARFDDTDIVHVITENLQIAGNPGGPILTGGVLTARESGRLRIDAGTIMKLGAARIEGEHGHSNFIAEGTTAHPVVLTSIFDDRYGRGGTFDTNDDGNFWLPGNPDSAQSPNPRDWGGIILNAASRASIDHAVIAFGGGLVPIEGGFDNFNVIEASQADLRLTNSRLENNAAAGSQSARNGRGRNDEATLFVRGSQPIIVGNTFLDNEGSILSINANSLKSDINRDLGRSTGPVEFIADPASGDLLFPDNRGPLVRLNVFQGNDLNGMRIRGEELTVESVWDDADIVHVLRDGGGYSSEVIAPNFHTLGGLRLQSSPGASLVIKLEGTDAGFTATGFDYDRQADLAQGLDIDDRIGGIVQIVGQPLHPVVLTALADDSIGAGFRPFDGLPQNDTNNDGSATSPAAGAWRSVRLEEFSHDRNVEIVNELERPLLRHRNPSLGDGDINAIPRDAQFLGQLAPNVESGDENRRLGFEVNGYIAADDPGDVDVYSFNANAGTQVWLDIDRTDPTLNAVIELVDPLGRLLARSSTPTPNNTSVQSFAMGPNPAAIVGVLTADPLGGGDFYTANPNDPGLRIVLPGVEGRLNIYHVRVRSFSNDLSVRDGGLTSGNYQL